MVYLGLEIFDFSGEASNYGPLESELLDVTPALHLSE